jgi:hypothetical protein
VKTPNEIRSLIDRRLQRTWHLDVTGDDASWPYEIGIGQVPSALLSREFAILQHQVREIRDWATSHGLEIRETNRRVHGTTQSLPTHVTVPDLKTAATICGAECPAKIARGYQRAAALRRQHPDCERIAWVVRSADSYTDLDFELLLAVAAWFTTNTADGLTPRQVPIPGVHAKWLNTHGPLVEALTAKPLRLAVRHPSRIHFTYLDPHHLAAGTRRFDSAVVGDTMDPLYKPDVVVITENKDTAIHFPPTAAAIAIEGCGFGGAVVAAFPWVLNAATIVYWGDIDAAGFEILDGYRRDGVPAESILMDLDTYHTYSPWGTFYQPNGQPIGSTQPKPLPHLTEPERSAYLSVCTPIDGLPPRVEQERIPLPIAHDALVEAVHRHKA